MGSQAVAPDNLTYLSFPLVSALDTRAGEARFHALVEVAKADVIFLDTLSKFVTGDEDFPTMHTAACNTAIVPSPRRGITVIALEHSGKDLSRGPRGGSSKGDNVDVLCMLTVKADNRLRLERRASRTGRGPDLVELVGY